VETKCDLDAILILSEESGFIEAKKSIETFLNSTDKLTDEERQSVKDLEERRQHQLKVLTSEFLKNKFERANALMDLKGEVATALLSRLANMPDVLLLNLLEMLGKVNAVDYDHLRQLLTGGEQSKGTPLAPPGTNIIISQTQQCDDGKIITGANQLMVNLFELIKAKKQIEDDNKIIEVKLE
jgi:hypothetical protein